MSVGIANSFRFLLLLPLIIGSPMKGLIVGVQVLTAILLKV
jgi:hypothetical protein